MLNSIRATDRWSSATECRLKEANASFRARQTDDLMDRHDWNAVARDWRVLAVAATAQEEMKRLTPAPSAPMADRAPSEKPPSAIRVLVAEDNAMNQLVMTAILRHGGIEPVMVGDGAQAVEAWAHEHWDVVLMDVQMPVLDGVSATRAIRAREAASGRAHTPIVAVTANVMPGDIQKYHVDGMDDVVAKPIDIVRLFAVLERILGPGGMTYPDEQRRRG